MCLITPPPPLVRQIIHDRSHTLINELAQCYQQFLPQIREFENQQEVKGCRCDACCNYHTTHENFLKTLDRFSILAPSDLEELQIAKETIIQRYTRWSECKHTTKINPSLLSDNEDGDDNEDYNGKANDDNADDDEDSLC